MYANVIDSNALPSAAELQVNYARAIARPGDPGAARHSVGFAHDARGNDFHDELTHLGGNMFTEAVGRSLRSGSG